ncbi:L-carnitine dehydratase/bile acid-inducible protein F [Candidatus Accumulibacter aalborgensis]|uniref:L-carnitine dehydratase/bile acid-inducible protein F n=1 Tax=Candidatus Accumulibacter aalborgensis TaxID=1860102 RepID=A0A1A8XY76_9PROT|nr:CaiB/BaiF CoA-transferase family protein [Candidatus Accumulibacter aalborgensis]SBT09919.1 L-carnitine dehydratase/bile acid-inducible protein F [Candidatus Accumulibacter aalborgensis]
MIGGPLTGVRVLDLTRLLPGPVATLHLADLGADVIKIEDHAAGDYARILGDGPDGVSVFYRSVNRNKRGLRLDLKQAQGRDVFLRLARTADIVVEGFRPGVSDKLGIGYEALREVNAKVVYCAITGYGQTGPLALVAGHDLNYIGFAGVLDQIGVDGGRPAIPNLQIGDLLGGAMTAAMGILAALFDAQRSGQGRLVDVAMSESVLAHNLFPLFALQNEGAVPLRGGDLLSGGDAGYGVYATADGRYMAVAPLEQKFWCLFCDALGRPDWKALHGARGAAAAALRHELEMVFASRSQADWQDVFAGVDCCVTPVLTVAEALEHPQFIARGMTVSADGVTQYAPPVKLSGWVFAVERAAPSPGEHSEEILREAGLSDGEILALRQASVI